MNENDDTHHLLNLPNHLFEQSNLLTTISTTTTSNSIDINSRSKSPNSRSINFSNQLNSINNNYYGINCNYFTESNLQNSSYNSLNSSPVHNYAQLSYSSSFPNFNNLHVPNEQLNQLTNRNQLNHNQTITTTTVNQPPLPPPTNQLTNPIFNNASMLATRMTSNQTNLDSFEYQQFVLSKLHNLSKSNIKKLSNDNLIDLGQKDEPIDESSVLNLFDPLSNPSSHQITYSTIKDTIKTDEDDDELINSIKSIQIKTADQLTEENFYETINYEKPNSSHSPSSKSSLVKKEIVFNNNLDYLKHRNLVVNDELINFKHKLVQLRSKFKVNDSRANCGFVISSRLNSPKDTCLSVKLIIDSEFAQPVSFTCNISTSVEHVVCHTVCSIFDSSTVNFNDYILKVFGLNEFLINDSVLGDYVYVNECHKFDKDVKLTLINRSTQKIDFYARTQADDEQLDKLNECDPATKATDQQIQRNQLR